MSAKLQENQGLCDVAIDIAAARAKTLREIKALLLNGDEQQALRLMRKHLGISEHKLKLVANK